ncbi:MAG: ankyrin repeat domain-containing protein [Candidatus Xenobiia bacterium LiM19]
MSRACSACDTENNDSDRFCRSCRKELSPAGGTARLSFLDNRYEILSSIKSGAMGTVYKARDNRLDNIVAVKKMLSTFKTPEEIRYAEERFREEAQLLSTLHHGGLPKVVDFFIETDPDSHAPSHYLVMTFIEGRDLEAIFSERKGTPFSVEETLSYFSQILDILDYLHSQKPPVIYRDLNPRNIMVQNGKVFLVDFGIARIFTPQKKGTVIGTPGYAAPEQYKGFAEPRSDLYALGVLIHYLLTGINPEESSTDIFSFKSPRTLNPAVPEYLDAAVMHLLEVVPEKRSSSANEVMAVLKSRSVSSSPSVPPCPPQPAKKAAGKVSGAVLHSIEKFYSQIPRHLIKLALCTAAVCLIFAAVMLVLKPGSMSRPAPVQSESLPEADISSLIASIKGGSIVRVKSIVESNPRLVNEKDQNKDTALHCAVTSRKVEIAGYLVEKASDINAKDNKGNTPLLLACREGNIEMAELLVEKGADISGKDYEFGSTALHWASYKGHIEVAEMLLSKGAEVKVKNNKGRTPLHWAADGNREKLAALLIEKGAKVDSTDNEGITPLIIAVQGGFLPIAGLLLDKGAAVSIPDNEGLTPLHMAAREGYVPIVKLLTAKKADVNGKDKTGSTPLLCAARENRIDAAKVLLHSGARIDMRDNEGKTAYNVAELLGNKDFMKILFDAAPEIRPFRAYLLRCYSVHHPEVVLKEHEGKGVKEFGVPFNQEEWKKIKSLDGEYLIMRSNGSPHLDYTYQLFCFPNRGKMLLTWSGYAAGNKREVHLEIWNGNGYSLSDKANLELDDVSSPITYSEFVDRPGESIIYVYLSNWGGDSGHVYTDKISCRML